MFTTMKKTYIIPELQVIKMHMQDSILLNTSETTVEGDSGGWVKEERGTGWSSSGKSVWDDDWSKSE
jgi:hypothetical protein